MKPVDSENPTPELDDAEASEFLRSYVEAGRMTDPLPPNLAQNVWEKLQPGMEAADLPLGEATASTAAQLKTALLAGTIGLAVGAGLAFPAGWWVGRQSPPMPQVQSALPTPVHEAAVAPDPQPPAVVAAPPPKALPPPQRVPVVKKVDTPAPGAPTTDLEQERRLIEQLRTALLQRQWAAVDEALAEHDSRFARGQLVEEREVMRIQRWMLAGDLSQARRLLEEFKVRFPQSRWSHSLEQRLAAP